MTRDVKPFSSIERAMLEIIVRDAEVPREQVGGDFGFDPATMDYYVRIDRVPGGSSTGLQGDFIIEIEVFGQNYGAAESLAFRLEALALGYPHVVEVDGRKTVFDTVSQNAGVADLPWEDDSTYRLGATYVITARRR